LKWRIKALLLKVFRFLASFTLGTIILVGFLLLLLVNNLSNRLLNADFYTRTLDEQDTYNRIYDEVLLDDAAKTTRAEWFQDIQLVDDEDIVPLLRAIMPPAYLRAEVEGMIQSSVDYINEDVETLELYLNLGPPLAQVKPVLFGYIDQRIDELQVVEPTSGGCTPEQLKGVGDSFKSFFQEAAGGRVAFRSVPSIRAIQPLCRGPFFDSIFTELVASSLLEQRVRQGLVNSREDIRREFVAGDTHQFLKAAARPLARPLIDDTIADITRELDGQDRLEVIPWLAKQEGNTTETQLRADIAGVRAQLSDRGWVKTVALVMLIGGTILLGLVYLPQLSNALRAPGLTLLLIGVSVYVLATLTKSALPDLVEAANIAPSARGLAHDIFRSFVDQLASGFTGPSVALIIVGAVLFAASFFVHFSLKPLAKAA
jgi:hypothetical protein